MRGKISNPRALAGARILLSTCLSLRKGDVFTLFWDESTRELRKHLIEAASLLELAIRERFVSLEEQKRFRGRLSGKDHEALTEVRGILTCLSSSPQSAGYRGELLKIGTSFDCYFGHMPGATLEVLTRTVDIDHAAAEQRCDDLALALTVGREAVLRTYELSESGDPVREFVLNIALLGLGRSPITSTGIIPKGTWGNIPGGEVFIAPAEFRAKGQFVLSGAFKNVVLAPGESILLDFHEGRLSGVIGNGKARGAFNSLLENVRIRGGEHYDVLAELGIGVNPGVTELTGTALFDEKCAGTVHIAIGDNERYGGTSYAATHEDFVSKSPSLDIDGKPVLKLGQDVFEPKSFRESIEDMPANRDLVAASYFFINHEVEIQRGAEGTLRVRRRVAEGRICEYTVGDIQTSRLLQALMKFLPGSLTTLVSRAEKELELGADRTIRGIEILVKHGLVCRTD